MFRDPPSAATKLLSIKYDRRVGWSESLLSSFGDRSLSPKSTLQFVTHLSIDGDAAYPGNTGIVGPIASHAVTVVRTRFARNAQ